VLTSGTGAGRISQLVTTSSGPIMAV